MISMVAIGGLAKFSKGSGLAKSDLIVNGAYPCIHYGELFTQYGPVIDSVISRTNRDLPIKSVAGDVLMPTSDVTPRGLAKASAIQITGVGLGGDVLIIRIDRTRADSRFLAYAIRNDANQVLALVRGSTVYHLYAADMRHFEVPLLPVIEQKRIADALSDTDALIAALERLITKKQAIKQGMMQELLTGRTRLPGFSDPWRPFRLRDMGSTYGGLTGKDKDDFGIGSSLYVTFLEVMASARLLGQRLERVSVRPGERQNQVRRGDILFNGSSETPEEVALAAVVDYDPTPRTYLNSFCFGYRLAAAKVVDPLYLAYFFRSGVGRRLIASLAQGATRYNISKTKLLELSPLLPRFDEQRAIVEVLCTVEDELDLINARLAKARDIKQGMMQELMTGRTRLPLQEAV